MRLLLVEDDSDLAGAMVRRLTRESYVVDHVATLGLAVEAVMQLDYRVVLLDRRLPDGDGIGLLPVLRTRPEPAAAIVLTALDDIPDRVIGLDSGAEDYLIKPFAIDELLARLRVLLRRSGRADRSDRVTVGQLSYDLTNREPYALGRPIAVPRRELALLDALVRRAGRVVLREKVEAAVYGFDDEVGPNALEAHVSRLRRRLNDAGAQVVIHGVRGVGYMLRTVE